MGLNYCQKYQHNQRLQNPCARAVTGIFDYDVSPKKLIATLGWMNIRERYSYFMSCLMFKCLNGNAPSCICDKFSYVCDNQPYTTRSAEHGLLHIPRPHTSLFMNSLSYFGPTTWNHLPDIIRNCSSLYCFKKQYKCTILNKFQDIV